MPVFTVKYLKFAVTFVPKFIARPSFDSFEIWGFSRKLVLALFSSACQLPIVPDSGWRKRF
jgi:hypothetical protein